MAIRSRTQGADAGRAVPGCRLALIALLGAIAGPAGAANLPPKPTQAPGPVAPAAAPASRTVAPLPDITADKGGVTIGHDGSARFVPWGSSIDLAGINPMPVAGVADGRCVFRVSYTEVNRGATTPAAHTNTLSVDGAPIANHPQRQLRAGQSASAAADVYLAEGTHTLRLSLDSGNAIAEADENNNRFELRYTLQRCPQAAARQPAAAAPAPAAPAAARYPVQLRTETIVGTANGQSVAADYPSLIFRTKSIRAEAIVGTANGQSTLGSYPSLNFQTKTIRTEAVTGTGIGRFNP